MDRQSFDMKDKLQCRRERKVKGKERKSVSKQFIGTVPQVNE